MERDYEKMSLDTKRLVNAEEVSDHTALLPTKNKAAIDFEELNLTDNEKKILTLVYHNLEEATSKPYRYEKTVVTLSYGGELFTATGVRNLELGWKKNRPDETKENLLPELKKGDRVAIEDVFIEKRQTEPPDHFTDGKLLHAMEEAGKSSSEYDVMNAGIGTSATRADTIEKLVSSGFVERLGGEGQPKILNPTELARLLYKVLPESLRSTELTAEWESKLLEIEKGKLDSKTFMEQIKDFTRTIISDANESAPPSLKSREKSQQETGI